MINRAAPKAVASIERWEVESYGGLATCPLNRANPKQLVEGLAVPWGLAPGAAPRLKTLGSR